MCNRVATPAQDELQGYFDKNISNQGHIFKIEPYQHYFNADGFAMPFLPITANDNPYVVTPAMWKLLPHWIADMSVAKKSANTLNARSEDIFTTASYKHYIGTKRALLWVKGFFEPNHPEPKKTVRYFIHAHNFEPFTMGCVFNDWTDKQTGETIRTFSIITTPPNQLLSRIHNEGQRMPLIITPEKRENWLSPLSQDGIIAMMQPLADGYLEGYAVGSIVYMRGVNTNVAETQTPV